MAPSDPSIASHLPLSSLDFHVLAVLAREDLYGYAIRKAVERDSGGAVAPEIGSLYRVLARLGGAGLVEETAAPDDAPDVHRGRPRKYYGLAPLGRRVLAAETERLAALVRQVRSDLPDPERP